MQKNENRPISITMHKTQVQMNQRFQHKVNHTEPHRRENVLPSTLEHLGTGDHFLNITSVAQTLRETINK